MARGWRTIAVAFATGGLAAAFPAEARKCPADSVQMGSVCVDKYEASVWETTDAKLVKKIQTGKIKDAAGLAAATPHGGTADDYGAGCPDTGEACTTFHAVSIPGVIPARNLTWFQAAAACRNAGKRPPTNQEWQLAALGTPDPGTDDGAADCNIASAAAPVNATYGSDVSCVGGDGSGGLPGALLRGGDFGAGTNAGVFAISAHFLNPSVATIYFGFRCARDL